MKQRRNFKRSSQCNYQPLEPRQLLATFVVDTSIDWASPTPDGKISLREAIVAANTNAPYGDAPAGDSSTTDTITFQRGIGITDLTAGQLAITEDLHINGNGLSVDARFQSRIFDINNVTVSIENLTLLNGKADDGGAIKASGSVLDLEGVKIVGSRATTGDGGAIYVAGGSLTAQVNISEGKATRGGGIFARDADIRIENSLIEDSYAPQYGGGIFVVRSSLEINGSEISDNTADKGGGGIASFSSAANLHLATIDSNQGSQLRTENRGGGILVSGGAMEIDYTYVNNNRAKNGGGIMVQAGGVVDITSGRIGSNLATSAGGGLANFSSTVNIHDDAWFESNSSTGAKHTGGGAIYMTGTADTTIGSNGALFGNRATKGFGGAIFSNSSGNLEIGGAYINNNYAFRSGGGIYVSGATLTTTESSTTTGPALFGNVARDNGGGIAIVNGTANIGTIYMSQFGSTNRAGYVYNKKLGLGGAIYSFNSDVKIEGSFAIAGEAYHGGGAIAVIGGSLEVIGVRDPTYAFNLPTIQGEILDSLAPVNEANKLGGGIYAYQAQVSIDTVQLQGETGVKARTDRGGVMFVSDSQVEISNSEIRHRTGSVVTGGAIHSGNKTELSIKDSTINGGGAIRGGNIFAAAGTSLVLEDTTLEYGGALLGGAIFSQIPLNLSGLTFQSNAATDTKGSGGAIYSNEPITVSNSQFVGNRAKFGGAIAGGGNLNVRDSTFSFNETPKGTGGAIHSSADLVTIRNATFSKNQATSGGAITFIGDSLYGRDLVFGGEELYNGNVAEPDELGGTGIGGAIKLAGPASASFTSTSFVNNSAATLGGAIALVATDAGTPALFIGAASELRSNSTQSTVFNEQYGWIVPDVGGGAVANLGGELDVRDSVFQQNTTDGRGGAIFNQGTDGAVTLRSVELSENTAALVGGAFFNDAELSVFDSEVLNNVAEVSGGGIFQTADSLAMFFLTEFEGNFG